MAAVEELALSVVAPQLTALAQALRGFGESLTAAAGSLVAPFQSLAAAVVPFVQVLNPALVNALNYAFDSLRATIGVALTPVVQALISGVRQAAGVLLPAMNAIAPVLGTIARTIMQLLLPVFRLVASILEEMAPIFQFVADAAKEIASGLNALSVVGRSLVEVFASWLKDLLGGQDGLDSFFDHFRDAIHKVTEALLQLAAYVAKLFGQGGTDFIRAMQRNLLKIAEGEGSKGGAVPAPQQGGFQSFEPLVKQMATAAFAAAGRAGEIEDKDEKAWLKDLAKMLGDIVDDGKTLQDFLRENVGSIARDTAIMVSNTGKSIDEKIGVEPGSALGFVAGMMGGSTIGRGIATAINGR